MENRKGKSKGHSAQLSKPPAPNLGKIALLGFGSQGRSLALNLRDSGCNPVVGLRGRSKSHKLAKSDKLASAPLAEAVQNANIVVVALPDQVHGTVFSSRLQAAIPENSTILFLHGLTVHFDLISLPETADIVLLAPHAPGLAVRESFLTGEGSISAFYSIHRDQSGLARQRLFGVAEAAGFKSANLLKTTFEHEALGDIFGEQAVLCGGLAMLIKNGFEVLVENGLKPDHAYLEVAYQLDLIIGLIKQFGIEGMLKRISVAARTGSVKNGPRIIDSSVKKRMKSLFDEIKNGDFTNQLDKLSSDDLRRLNRQIGSLSHPDLEKAARKFSK